MNSEDIKLHQAALPISGSISGTISGATRVHVIIGDPIAQVGSPRLFNQAFHAMGEEAVLVPVHVAADGLTALLDGLRRMRNLAGIVVTIPHKLAVIEHVDEVGTNAARVGAINAIRCTDDGRWVGDNFDGAGCVRGLQDAGHSLAGRGVQLIGAGGAGRAVAHAFADAGISRIAVSDPMQERAEALVASLGAAHPELAASCGHLEGPEVIMNCTPLGMRDDDPMPMSPEQIAADSLVVDAVLRAPMSPWLAACEQRGCRVQPGLRMLEGQVASIIEFLYGGECR